MPTTGARKTFALLIEFQDDRHHNSAQAIEQTLYGKRGVGAPYESVALYYDRASYHKLDLFGGTTLGWYLTPYARTKVRRSDAGRDQLVKEALQYFHSQGFDFSQYDTDHDGIVDFFYVLWAGDHTNWGSFWWPYQTVFDDWNFTLNGVRFWRYAWMWESSPAGAPFDAATAIHETGHALGLPDYYDYDKTKGPPGGLGGLDMMDSTKHDHNCFSKWMLDWLTPTPVTAGSRVVTLGPSGSSGDCVLMWHGTQRPALFSEFFMVQNRERVGNDVAIPGEGLSIWHIDARVSRGNFVCDNSFSSHKLLRLMEGDGLEEIQAGKPADAGDFYQPGMSFGAATLPSSVGYRRRRSGIEVKDIRRQANGLSATFAVVGP
jgi:M6 family metalloprotease-like protein